MKSVNERAIKLSGQANIEQDLVLSHEYSILIENVECRGVEELPNDDGTTDKIFKLKASPLSRLTIKADNGEIITTKTKGSPSQRLRNAIRYLHPAEDNERFYNNFINHLILNLETYLEKYDNEVKQPYVD